MPEGLAEERRRNGVIGALPLFHFRKINKFIRQKAYLEACNQLENFNKYAYILLEDPEKYHLTKSDCVNLIEILEVYGACFLALATTFSNIGRMDLAQQILEKKNYVYWKFHEILSDKNDEEDQAVARFVMINDSVIEQLVMGNNTGALKNYNEYENELKILKNELPNVFEDITESMQPYINFMRYIGSYLKDNHPSKEKIKLLEDVIASIDKPPNLKDSIILGAASTDIWIEKAILEMLDGFEKLKTANLIDAKNKFKRAEIFIKKTNSLNYKGASSRLVYMMLLNISKLSLNLVESRIKSNTVKYETTKKQFNSNLRNGYKPDTVKESNEIIKLFDKSFKESIYSNEFQEIVESMIEKINVVLSKSYNRVIIGGFISDSLPISIEKNKKLSNINQQFLIQGLGIILMVFAILAEKSSVVLMKLGREYCVVCSEA